MAGCFSVLDICLSEDVAHMQHATFCWGGCCTVPSVGGHALICTGFCAHADALRQFGQLLGGMQHVLPCWQDRGAGVLLLWVAMDRLHRLKLSCEPGSGHVHSTLEVCAQRAAGTCAHAAQ